MISLLRGKILEKQAPFIVLDVHGVGYELQVPISAFFGLPDNGTEATLHTHFVVREDAQQLYGFVERRDRELFRELIKVNGVGPKIALAVLSALETDRIVECVKKGDLAMLVKVPGIGRKTAERMLVELRDRFKAWNDVEDEQASGSTGRVTVRPQDQLAQDAESALVALGYKLQEASKLVSAVLQEQTEGSLKNSEDLIRMALRRTIR